MNAKLFLRSAAVITLLLTLGHLLGSPWTPVHTPAGLAVVTAMKSYRFPAMGFERTYYEFYVGFGWLLGVYAAAHAVIFWQLAGLSSQFPGKLRPIVAVLCLEAVCGTVLEWQFLFWAPIVFSAATAACLAVAWRLMRPRPGPETGARLKADHGVAAVNLPPAADAADHGAPAALKAFIKR